MKDVKVAIVHDYLNTYGGAESIVNAIWELYPNAPIYTSLYDKKAFEGTGAFEGAKIVYPKWADSPCVNRLYKYFTFSYPLVFESFDLREYDLIISSSANFAKGVLTNQSQLHISYIHTPPRFLYGYKTETSKRDKWYWQLILKGLDSYLRVWDYAAAQRPDFLLCNSRTVKERIRKFYKREAKIIYPFAAVKLHQKKDFAAEDFFLVVSRLSKFKHVDLVIRAAYKKNLTLKIAGTGKEFKELRELSDGLKSKSKGKVEFLGFVSEAEKTRLYQTCKAVICATEDEDFGMVPLEAMSFGKPVIALRSGGYTETIKEGKNGVFFEEPVLESLIKALNNFKNMTFDDAYIKNYAKKFSKRNFQKNFKEFVDEKWEQFSLDRLS